MVESVRTEKEVAVYNGLTLEMYQSVATVRLCQVVEWTTLSWKITV